MTIFLSKCKLWKKRSFEKFVSGQFFIFLIFKKKRTLFVQKSSILVFEFRSRFAKFRNHEKVELFLYGHNDLNTLFFCTWISLSRVDSYLSWRRNRIVIDHLPFGRQVLLNFQNYKMIDLPRRQNMPYLFARQGLLKISIFPLNFSLTFYERNFVTWTLLDVFSITNIKNQVSTAVS